MRVWSEGQYQNSAFSFSEESKWPPRCYNCNFCEREFKSAQALGGHMNVHRRDRALLRLSSDSNSNSNYTSSLLPPDKTPLTLTSKRRNSLLNEAVYRLLQIPQLALPTSPDNRSIRPSPFFEFFPTSSPNLGLQGQSQYSNKADLCKLRIDAVYSNPFEINIEQGLYPSVVRSLDVENLEIKMDWRTVRGHDGPNNVGLDLELRLGYTSSSCTDSL